MTKDVIPGSRSKSISEQKKLVAKYEHYRFPKAREAVICIAMEYIVSGNQLYGCEPLTNTRCAETVSGGYPVVVGGFGPAGLDVSDDRYDSECYGVGPLRVF